MCLLHLSILIEQGGWLNWLNFTAIIKRISANQAIYIREFLIETMITICLIFHKKFDFNALEYYVRVLDENFSEY